MPRKKKKQYCQGCNTEVTNLTAYCNRFKVCQTCKQKPQVKIKDEWQRFCNKCGHFESLDKFDDAKKTCRVKLQHHNILRRGSLRKTPIKKNKESKNITKPTSPSATSPNAAPRTNSTNTQDCLLESMTFDKFVFENQLQSNNNIANNQIIQNQISSNAQILNSPKNDLLEDQRSIDTKCRIFGEYQNQQAKISTNDVNSIDSANNQINQINLNFNSFNYLSEQNQQSQQSLEFRNNTEEFILELLGKYIGMQITMEQFVYLRTNKEEADNFVEFILQKYYLGQLDKLQLDSIITILEIFKLT